ncbi:MAG: hypothetical protein ACYC6C_09540 [Coriobacteriia bacterium]
MVETDGIEESLEGVTRVAVMAGARLGEQLSQAIAQRARELEARAVTEARDLRDRFEAERAAAVAEVKQVHSAEFWNQNDPQRIGQTFATARAWSDLEPEARSAENRMKVELHERYGIVTDALDGDPAKVQEWVARLEAERLDRLAQEERRKEREDRADAALTLSEADRLDAQAAQAEAAAQHEPDLADRDAAATQAGELREASTEKRGDSAQEYDSADRRATRAAELEGKQIDQETVATRMRADVSQGRPAADAVLAGKAAKARKTRIGAAAGRTQQLGR